MSDSTWIYLFAVLVVVGVFALYFWVIPALLPEGMR